MSTQPMPLAIERLDTEAFRRKLAGLADPSRKAGSLTPAIIREMAKRFCSILANLFDRKQLDPLTLWDRIHTALRTASAQVSDDDFDRFVTICLEVVQADVASAAACEPLAAVLETMSRSEEDRYALMNYIRDHHVPLLVFSRQRHKQVLAGEIEL